MSLLSCLNPFKMGNVPSYTANGVPLTIFVDEETVEADKKQYQGACEEANQREEDDNISVGSLFSFEQPQHKDTGDKETSNESTPNVELSFCQGPVDQRKIKDALAQLEPCSDTASSSSSNCSMADSFQRSQSSYNLKKFSLVHCRIHPRDGSLRKLENVLREASGLQVLELVTSGWDNDDSSNNDENLRIAQAYVELLGAAAHSPGMELQRLIFSMDGFGNERLASHIQTIMRSKPKLRELNITNCGHVLLAGVAHGLKDNTRLQELCLSSCGIDDVEFCELLPAIQSAANITKIDLSGNEMSAVSLPLLAKMIKTNRALKSLDCSAQIDLFQDCSQDQQLKPFLEAVNGSNSLQALCLHTCSMKDETAAAVFRMLAHNTTLVQLDLDFNNLTLVTMQNLLESLPDMKGLQQLELDGLEVDDLSAVVWGRAAKSLFQSSLAKNSRLQCISLDSRLFAVENDSIAAIIQSLLRRNEQLHRAEPMVQKDEGHIPMGLWPQIMANKLHHPAAMYFVVQNKLLDWKNASTSLPSPAPAKEAEDEESIPGLVSETAL